VGHLGTASRAARPHVVPVCFALLDESTLVFAVDDKPKPRSRPLRRLQNLVENDRFCFLVDHWDEDWRQLGFLLIEGSGTPCSDAARSRRAIESLRERYRQYVEMHLSADAHAVIELHIERIHRWGRIG
jgi:PPOX class probable F420-dependent enzyme